MSASGQLFVAGSINQDILIELDRQPQKGETLPGRTLKYAPGGKGANQAVAAAKTGAKTQLLAAVGEDEFGGRLLRHLKSQGVNIKKVFIKEETSTGVAIVMVAESDNSIIIFGGANESLSPEDVLKINIREGDLALAQCETPQETSLALFKKARSNGAKCILNPSPATNVSGELIQNTDYLLVNEIELATLLGEDSGSPVTPEHLQKLKSRFELEAVICTLGSKGLLATSGNQIVNMEAAPVKVVDTTGAGDTFCGVFASSLLRGKNYQEALAYANLAGSLAVRSLGAQNAMPDLLELEKEASGKQGF